MVTASNDLSRQGCVSTLIGALTLVFRAVGARVAAWSSARGIGRAQRASSMVGAQHEVGAAAQIAAGESLVQQRVDAFEHRPTYHARACRRTTEIRGVAGFIRLVARNSVSSRRQRLAGASG
jgi:hypothetical protein